MLRLILIGSALIATTVLIHAIGTSAWVHYLSQKYLTNRRLSGRLSMLVLVYTALIVLALHTIEITMWAITYKNLVPIGELASFEEAVYFSIVTFTSLGYGDITLSESWRLLSGIEALNGIILVGWSTAMIFAVVQHVWRGLAEDNQQNNK